VNPSISLRRHTIQPGEVGPVSITYTLWLMQGCKWGGTQGNTVPFGVFTAGTSSGCFA